MVPLLTHNSVCSSQTCCVVGFDRLRVYVERRYLVFAWAMKSCSSNNDNTRVHVAPSIVDSLSATYIPFRVWLAPTACRNILGTAVSKNRVEHVHREV